MNLLIFPIIIALFSSVGLIMTIHHFIIKKSKIYSKATVLIWLLYFSCFLVDALKEILTYLKY